MKRLWARWIGLVISVLVLLGYALVLSGCTTKSFLGEFSVLPDLVPSGSITAPVGDWRPARVSIPPHPNPVVRNPSVPFDGMVRISLGNEFVYINGLIAQELAMGCGLSVVEPDAQQRRNIYNPPPILDYRYDLRIVVSRGEWSGQEIPRVAADIKLIDLVPRTSPRMAHTVEFYGSGLDYSGRRVRGHATYERAAEMAIQKATHALCFSDPPRGAELREELDGSLVPGSSACQPPSCYEYQQTICVYGTCGGTGINSYGPTHDRGQQEERHHGQHHDRGGGKRR